MAKRRRQDSQTLKLMLAGTDPLEVDAGIVRRASRLAEGLPEGATEWDLSGLTSDGQPFEKDTVVQWLNCAYTVFGDYGDDDSFDSDNFVCTAVALHALLAFSDAVLSRKGAVLSRKGIFTACLEQLDDLTIRSMLAANEVDLCVTGGVYAATSPSADRWQLTFVCPTEPTSQDVLDPCSGKEWTEFVRGVALQAESLMYIGHKLKMQPLIQTMHTFLQKHCFCGSDSQGLLLGKLGLVFSERVVDAALGSSSMTKQEWVRSILTQPCGFVEDVYGQNSMLRPDFTSIQFKDLTLYFTATLLKDYAGSKEGSKVDVEVRLFGMEYPEMLIGGVPTPVQLCIGHGIADQQDFNRVMGSS